MRSALRNVLWVAAEPENGKVSVDFTSTLKPTGKWIYCWMLKTESEELSDKERLKGRISSNTKTNITIPSPLNYGEGIKSGYVLSLRAFQVVNGSATKVYFTKGYKPAFEVRTFTSSYYQSRVETLHSIAQKGERFNISPFAASLTRIFLNENPASSSYTPNNLAAPPLFPLNAHQGTAFTNSLTHIAGTHFGNDYLGTGQIPRFVFGPTSGPAVMMSRRSTAIHELIVANLKVNKAAMEAKMEGKEESGIVTHDVAVSNGMINWSKTDSDDLDTYFALGGVNLRNSTISVVLKKVHGRTSIQRLRFKGNAVDLTDFDYTGVYPSNPASIVQIGWEPHTEAAYSRDKGRIFYTEVNMNTLFTRPGDDSDLDEIGAALGWYPRLPQ